MKKQMMAIVVIASILILCINSVISLAAEQPIKVNTDIRLNSLGYLPAAQKKASIISKCEKFDIREAEKGKAVFSGKVTGPFKQADYNDSVWIADFSKVNKAGKYYIDIAGVGRSYDFEIGEKVYNIAYVTTMRAFYLWRCGTEVNAIYNGNHYFQKACHLDDAWLDYIGEPNKRKDGTGGWHDAGDYNKYVVNAGITVGCMFLAWEQFRNKIKDVSLGLPDTAPGYPDYLKELKWETDWLLKMQYPDGSGKVSHKVSALKFCAFIMPDEETEKRYFTDWSTAATADFVAMMAMASRIFQPYDANYAKVCLDAALKSNECLMANRDNKMSERKPFRTGAYPTQDQDDRLWAMAELWETTGEPNYKRGFEFMAMAYEDKIDFSWDWGSVKNLGMFTYILSKRGDKHEALAADMKRDLLRIADDLVRNTNRDVYGRNLGDEYRWGSNGTVAREVLTLQAANKISPNPEYVNASLDAIANLFGRNFYCRSYVTGLGYKPPMNPHDRRSGADQVRDPWPGYVVGGGEASTDWQDIQADPRTNEIAINWQGALVYVLAGFVN